MRKINLLLIVLILGLGVFVLFKQLSPTETDIQDEPPVDEGSSYEGTREVGFTEPKPVEDTRLSEFELHKQIKNKRYLENTYMALEYSKVNGQILIDTLKNYSEDNTKMKPEDVRELILINEKTFLNRYLKVFVSAPDEELNELNNEMRRIFYQMKLGFDDLKRYGGIPVVTSGTNMTGEEHGESNEEYSEYGPDFDVDGEDGGTGEGDFNYNSETSATNIPREEKRDRTPVYDMEDIQSGIQQLETIFPLVNEAIKLLGIEDINIEQQWLEAGISESDLNEMINKTNIVNPELSGEESFGEVEEKNREERLEEKTIKE